MTNLTDRQHEIIAKYGMKQPGIKDNLKLIPLEDITLRCDACEIFFKPDNQLVHKCPKCGRVESVEVACPIDTPHGHSGVMPGIHTCLICGEYYCPECGAHDVAALSRVTGYLGDVGAWNEGKKQELKDRTRYDVPAEGSP